jgi:hypothetical protein
MANDVYLCFECGTKNRVSATADRSRAKCAKCKADLFPEEASKTSATTRRPQTRQSTTTPSRRPPPEESTGKAKLIIGLVVAGIVVAFFVSNNESDRRSPSRTAASPTTQPVPTAPLPPAVFQAAGIMFNRTGVSGNHPFEIMTSPGSGYFVKLVDSATGVERVGIFVKGGQRIEVEVPAGQYHMRYASGETWRGMQHLFGPGSMTSYQASSDIFNFNLSGGYYRGYTVELIRQAGGNMDTRSISASSF